MKWCFQKPALAVIAFLAIAFPTSAMAIPPPDFLIQVASQIGSFFAIGMVLCSVIFSTLYQFVKAYAISHKKTFWTVSLIAIVSTAGIGAYFFDQHYQHKQQTILTDKWSQELRESENGLKSAPPENTDIPLFAGNETDFYKLNKDLDEKISNAEFRTILGSSAASDYIILDARENIEYELGHIPGSIHMRFADLTAGEWKELPTDKHIYVICFSGMRGKEVSDFLRDKKLAARYLEKGAFDWVNFGGNWEGKIDFYKVFAEERYSSLLSAEQLEQLPAEVVLVDTRLPQKYSQGHLGGAINIATLSTPSSELQSRYAQVVQGSKVVTICDELASCFDATVTGIELERRGVIFLGKYSTSGEF